jgi:ketosteroid isomerase-like protein
MDTTTEPLDGPTAERIMGKFAGAYFSKDQDRLAEAITEDAEWHFAFGPDAPHGRVRRGLDGFMQGMAENDAIFEHLRFNDVAIRPFGHDQIVMTYLVEGRRRDGEDFTLRGVELITVQSGRLALKDVYWKQTTP